ncbi:MAG: hypothetical protein BIFFINMI_01999 [Phycisphaerae bacterium]|nr:hypothetical protein [Phycisphaerae bacterium]
MADSVLVQIADAVVAELNAPSSPLVPAEGDPLATAARAYAPVFDLGEMADLHVTVVPKAASAERADRATRQFDYSVDVAVQKKLGDGGDTEVDGLMLLVERIADHFNGKRPVQYAGAVCLRADNEPVYSPDHLRELRQFTSVLTLVFRVVR